MEMAGTLHKEDVTMEEKDLQVDAVDWEACQVEEVSTSEEPNKEIPGIGLGYLSRALDLVNEISFFPPPQHNP